MVIAQTHTKFWWQCQKGHEWQHFCCERTGKNKIGCPYCADRLVCKENSLFNLFPEIAAEFHKTMNGNITPNLVVSRSTKKYWWQCNKGHEWQVTCNARTKQNRGCPYCTSKKVCPENCLNTLSPQIALEWHPIKNGNLTPKDITNGSGRRVWWQCSKGHEWKTTIASRTGSEKCGCPYCSGRQACQENCLETLSPQIALEWHPTKNGDLTPKDVVNGSHQMVWWKGKCGHEWKMAVVQRTSGGYGCHYCSGHRVCQDNCLATLSPMVALEWHSTKNGNLTSKDIVIGSHKKIWWQCSKNHEWQSTVKDRIGKNSGCPYCSGRQACQENCLETLSPQIALEWHPTKNGDLTPKDVTNRSNKKVWWKCAKNHEWYARIASRTGGNNCPICCESKGEKKISEYLTQKGKNTKQQHRIKHNRWMIFDFVVRRNGKLAIIEYQGEQHYQPVRFGGMTTQKAMIAFKKALQRDQNKRDWCKLKGYDLLEIPYWEFDRIEEILDEFYAGKWPVMSPPPAEQVAA